MGQWDNYFLGTAGASAALTGLVFVGVSINLQHILAVKHLPSRALGSMILLTNILLVSLANLIPNRSAYSLAFQIFSSTLCVYIITIKTDIKDYAQLDPAYKTHFFRNLLFTQISLFPYLLCVWYLLFKPNEALNWLVSGISFSFIKSLIDAWVLLVEIKR